VSWQLAIARPELSQTLDSERIALLRGATMDYYADAQWSDTVPRLVQSQLVQAFEESGRILAVARESAGVRADYTLTTEIRDFNAQYNDENSAPLIVVDMEAKILAPRGAVVAAQNIRQTAAAAANSVPAVVAAFDQALGAALAGIVAWTLSAAPPPARS